jgi:hypothetical protein
VAAFGSRINCGSLRYEACARAALLIIKRPVDVKVTLFGGWNLK